jgi:hypothetical protein
MYFELDPVMEAGRPNPKEDNDTFDGIFTVIGALRCSFAVLSIMAGSCRTRRRNEWLA